MWATSWGVSTRLVGAMVMSHSDDKGKYAPHVPDSAYVCMCVQFFLFLSFSSSLTLPLVPPNSIRNATPLSLFCLQQLGHFFPFSSLYYSLCPLLSSPPKVWFYLLPLLPFKWSSCPSQTVRAYVRACVCVFYCIAIAWVCDLLCHESI